MALHSPAGFPGAPRQTWRCLLIAGFLGFCLSGTLPAVAAEDAPKAAADKPTLVPIGYLKQEVEELIPLSRLNAKPDDLGIAGAEIALKDNNTTGKFTGQNFTLDVERIAVGGDAVAGLRKLLANGHHFVLVDAPADVLLQLSDSVKGQDVLLFNVSAPEVRLFFGPYLPFRTWDPRPVAGTAGLEAMSWHPAHEQWGATQMQNRFQRFAQRFMLPLDHQAWIAVRAVGEAASRTQSGDYAPINAYIRGDKFDLAAFKGQKVTFRKWDGQLRQPIIIAGPELPVSTSPQSGFLHEHEEVDTLGIDAPESKCELQ